MSGDPEVMAELAAIRESLARLEARAEEQARFRKDALDVALEWLRTTHEAWRAMLAEWEARAPKAHP
jgi:hypothetical protein